MIVHDEAALRAARALVRTTYLAVRALPQADPSIRCLASDLDDLCIEITLELDAMQPLLPLEEGV